MPTSSASQRRLAHEALNVLEPYGFALAGSGAIREHGLINRPTEDIDLFTVMRFESDFPQAVRDLETYLHQHGYEINIYRQTPTFCQIAVTDTHGQALNIDLGIDWRANPPTRLAVGSVLSRDDAVGNKVAALYSRGEPRDFYDVDAIRQSGIYSDEALLQLAQNADPGFEPSMFANRLASATRLHPRSFEAYGISSGDVDELRQRCQAWAHSILAAPEKSDSTYATSTHEKPDNEQLQDVNTASSTEDEAARRRRIALGGGAPQRTSTTPPSPTVRPPTRDHDHER